MPGMTYELGIIGAGNMAEAIVRGVLHARLMEGSQIVATDVSAERRELFEKQLGVRAIEDNARVAGDSKVILLSVKPQHMESALAGLGAAMSEQTLVVSIAAGVSTGYIESHLGQRKAWRVIRTMPNTPMLVGEGMVGMAPGKHATAADVATARRIFEAAATVIDVKEEQIDAVTAVSGSGPAYFFFLIEQMIQAGIDMGLTAQQAHTLATRTAAGAAKMLVSSPDSPQELRRKVTSPGGTTHAAIAHMESHQWPQITVDAVKAAQRRSRELGR
jgi:pyrroline-5-carboxylate reductase